MLVKFIYSYDLNEIELKQLFNDFLREFVYPIIQENGLEGLYLNHDNNEVFLPANGLYNIETIKNYVKHHDNLLVFVNAQFIHDIVEEFESHPDNIDLLKKHYTLWGLFKGEKCSFFQIDNDCFDESNITIVSDYLYYTINYFDNHFIPSNFEPFFNTSGYSFLHNSFYELKHYEYFERINKKNVIRLLNELLKKGTKNDEEDNWKIPVNNIINDSFEIKTFKDYVPICNQPNYETPEYYNKHKYTLILDTETNGLPNKFDSPFPYLNYPEIVQISWAIFDKYDRLIKVQNFIVKPDGYRISEASTKIHGIHDIQANRFGVQFEQVINELFKDISTCDLLVGHNIEYDIKIIESHCHKYYSKNKAWSHIVENGFFKQFEKLETFCSMKDGANYIERSDTNKWMTLEELYNCFFSGSIQGLHNSLKDIWVTNYCFQQIKWTSTAKFKLLIPTENSNG